MLVVLSYSPFSACALCMLQARALDNILCARAAAATAASMRLSQPNHVKISLHGKHANLNISKLSQWTSARPGRSANQFMRQANTIIAVQVTKSQCKAQSLCLVLQEMGSCVCSYKAQTLTVTL